MIKHDRGYSLGVLVITIAVMIILSTVAIVSFKNTSSDKEVTNFMNDIREVEEYVREYYSSKHILPIKYDRDTPLTLTDLQFEKMRTQAGQNDLGAYYFIDLDKLERIHLKDKDRGYVVNENSLKVYAFDKPLKYNGEEYYTITDEMSGYDKTYNDDGDFEIVISGNPITWTDKAKLILSIPGLYAPDGSSVSELTKQWTFKYFAGHAITADEFKDHGKLFLYGEIVEIAQNGVVSFYVENDKGHAKVVNVVITQIDNIKPTINLKGNRLELIDNETGINQDKLLYKIKDYDDLTDATGGRDLLTYGVRYKKYLDDYNRICGDIEDTENTISVLRARGSGEAELIGYISDLDNLRDALEELNEDNRDFNDGATPYGDNVSNIAIYAEDYAKNSASFTDGVSRDVLLDSGLIDYELELLDNSVFDIVKTNEYVSGDRLYLRIRSVGATKMLITTDPSNYSPEDILNYDDFEASNGGYVYNISTVPEGKDIVLYAYYTAGQRDSSDNLIYESLSDTFSLDRTMPTEDAPTVEVSNQMKVTVKVNQKDTGSGIGPVAYGYLLGNKTDNIADYTWCNTTSELETAFRPGENYFIRTKLSDNAGNGPAISDATKVQCPSAKISAVPNAPLLADGYLTAVTWKSNNEPVTINPSTLKDQDGITRVWYDYSMGDGINDNGTSKWANARANDGSYFVWIPRFAYRVIYYTDSTKSEVKGYYQNSAYSNNIDYYLPDGKTASTANEVKTLYGDIDIVFLYNTEDDRYYDSETKLVKSLIGGGDRLYSEYIVHPAFKGYSAGTSTNSYGRWSRELQGIWVSKFEASRSDATYSFIGNNTTIKSVPSVKSLTGISANDAFNYSNNYLPTMNSHLIKNSEWGAVSLLSYSAYGRNGHDVKSNLATNLITGAGTTSNGATYSATALDLFEGQYGYQTSRGFAASTTNNIWGVYDMVGGANEFTASYVNNSSSSLSNNGVNIQGTSNMSLAQPYNKGTPDSSSGNFTANSSIFGDAIQELATSSANIWGRSSITYPTGDTPFFARGGSYNDDYIHVGIFNVNGVSGASDEDTGFRFVLAP